jgi:hypothetical protein
MVPPSQKEIPVDVPRYDFRHRDDRHQPEDTEALYVARSGVPLARLQRLMGHAHPHMTMRYMRHTPNGDFAADAARVAGSMALLGEHEADARAVAARTTIASA